MSSRIIILILILFAIDLYVFQGVRFLIQSKSEQFQRITTVGFWLISFLAFFTIILGQFVDWHSWPKFIRTFSFSLIVIIYLSKVFVLSFLLIDDVFRLFRWLGIWTGKQINPDPGKVAGTSIRVSRLDFLVKLGFIIGAVPFFSMIYGMIGGAYDYKVRKVKLKFPKLPGNFDGFRFVQISDLHTGSFMGTDHLKKAIELVMNEKPDAIFVTGDLVNDQHTEALPFREIFSSLNAPHGVHSIFGNHDYGDYMKWPSLADKISNLENLKKVSERNWLESVTKQSYFSRKGWPKNWFDWSRKLELPYEFFEVW